MDIPILLDFSSRASITGLCPIRCDANGSPTGKRVQLSKNWHDDKMGYELIAYTAQPN